MNFTLLWNVFVFQGGNRGWVIYRQMGASPNRKPWEILFTSVPSQNPVSGMCSSVRGPLMSSIFSPIRLWRCQFPWPWRASLGLLIYWGHRSLLLATGILCACSVSLPTVRFTQPPHFTHPFVCFCKLPFNCLISSLEARVSDKALKSAPAILVPDSRRQCWARKQGGLPVLLGLLLCSLCINSWWCIFICITLL